MTVIQFEGIDAFGAQTIHVMTGYDGDGNLSLATDVNGTGALNISCFLLGDEWNVSTQENVGEGPRLFCRKKADQRFGQETTTVPDWQYTYDPQGDPEDDNNKARATLTRGTQVWIIDRRGVDATEPILAGDVVDLHQVVLGVQNKTRSGGGEFDIFTVTQKLVHRRTIEDVTVAA